MDVITGTEHGDQALRVLCTLNVLPLSVRRRAKKAEMGRRILDLGMMECKKDTAEIMDHIKSQVNEGIKKTKASELVGIRDLDGNVR